MVQVEKRLNRLSKSKLFPKKVQQKLGFFYWLFPLFFNNHILIFKKVLGIFFCPNLPIIFYIFPIHFFKIWLIWIKFGYFWLLLFFHSLPKFNFHFFFHQKNKDQNKCIITFFCFFYT